MFIITERDTLQTSKKWNIKFRENFCRFRIREKTCDELVNRHRRLVIRHDDSNEDDEDFDDFSDIEPELVQLNHRGRGLSDTGKHYNSVLEMYHPNSICFFTFPKYYFFK